MNTWMRLMRSSGFDEDQSKKWHMLFEQISPSEHTIFLETLGLSKGKINEIKTWSKGQLDRLQSCPFTVFHNPDSLCSTLVRC